VTTLSAHLHETALSVFTAAANGQTLDREEMLVLAGIIERASTLAVDLEARTALAAAGLGGGLGIEAPMPEPSRPPASPSPYRPRTRLDDRLGRPDLGRDSVVMPVEGGGGILIPLDAYRPGARIIPIGDGRRT